jgi:hypothetical protein
MNLEQFWHDATNCRKGKNLTASCSNVGMLKEFLTLGFHPALSTLVQVSKL